MAAKQSRWQLNRPLIIFYILVAYIFASFLWWSYLLFSHSSNNYENVVQIQKYEYERNGLSPEDFEGSPAFEALKAQHKRQVYMIVGEAIVFFILLTFAVLQIRKSFQNEIRLARQQRNFLLSITHELKSPLASIKLALETLLKRDLEKERMQQVLRNSVSDVNRLQKLVEDILFAAKFDDHQFRFRREPVNLSAEVKHIATRVAQNSGKHHHFSLDVEDGIIMVVDKETIDAMVQNLLENAVKYSPADSAIRLRLLKRDGVVQLEVADEGVGIPDEEKPHIFKKFYRVGSEETRRTKGTGLGLFIVKEVAKGHQGQVKVLDNEPQGTLFQVELPLQEQK